jgi:hypothetical protein
LLEQETDALTQEPSGAGLEMPAWLQALDEEVRRVCRFQLRLDYDEVLNQAIEIKPLPLPTLRQRLPEADPDDVL